MNRILKEETYPDGSPRIRETLLADGKTIVKEAWYPSGVDPGNPPAQEYKENYVNGEKHGVQEVWYPSGVDPSDPWQATDSAQRRGGRQVYKETL
jgi:antitoxin component YwqK of YwqJK toxin-antitoxin module